MAIQKYGVIRGGYKAYKRLFKGVKEEFIELMNRRRENGDY